MGLLTSISEDDRPFQRDLNPSDWIIFMAA